MNVYKNISIVLVVVGLASWATAGIQDRFSDIELMPKPDNYIKMPDLGANPSGNPLSGEGRIFINSDTLYFENDSGTITSLTASAVTPNLTGAYQSGNTLTMDSSGDFLIQSNPDTNPGTVVFDTITGSGNLDDAIRVTTTSGGVTDAIDLSDAGIVNAINVGENTISGTSAVIDFTNFDVDASGNVTAGGAIYQSAVAAAASGNVNLTVDAAGTGTITIGGTSTGLVAIPNNNVDMFGSSVDIGNAASDTLTITSIIDSNVTLHDGTTDSPSLILKDATDETATITKVDGGNLTVTPNAGTQSLNVLTGNLAVGNGSPGTASMNGEDAYIEGELEVDGAVQLDGALTAAGTIAAAGNITIDDGVGDSPSITLQDATNETAVIVKGDSSFMTITTAAADGVNVLVGNLKVGNGTPDVAQNGEDAYVEGTLEVDAATTLDSTLTVAGTLQQNEEIDINLDANDEEIDVNSTAADYAAGSGIVTVYDDSTGQTNASYLLRLAREADADAQDHFILCEDNSTGAAANGDDMFKVDTGGEVTTAGAINAGGFYNCTADSELTIATGAITATKSYHNVDTEGDAASDDLDTISGGTDGDIIVLTANNAGRTVVIKNGTDNIICGADISLDNTGDTATLIYDGTNWLLISSSNNN